MFFFAIGKVFGNSYGNSRPQETILKHVHRDYFSNIGDQSVDVMPIKSSNNETLSECLNNYKTSQICFKRKVQNKLVVLHQKVKKKA
jgi:hypothetical protein